jgi:hypothetical protein
MGETDGGWGYDTFDDGTLPHYHYPQQKEDCVQLEFDDFNNYNPIDKYKKIYQDAWRNEKVIRAEWLREGEEIPVSVMDDDEALIRGIIVEYDPRIPAHLSRRNPTPEESEMMIRSFAKMMEARSTKTKKKGFIERIFWR